VAARQDTFDRTLLGADHLIASATPSGATKSERGEEAAWEQTQALMQGVVDIATELGEAGFRYKARNRSKAWKLDTGWYPTSMYDSMQDPEHAVNKLTRPYQWLRREAISNLRIMQALGRPRMTRQVLTPGQDEELGVSTGLDAKMQDTDLLNERDADCREMGPTEKLARYYAACYVEIPWCESQRALEMLMSWFGERTMEWVTDECARAGVSTKVSEVKMVEPSAPGLQGHQYPVGHTDHESKSPHWHPRRRRPQWTYTTNVLPMDARRWYAMGVTDSICSPPTAATHAGASIRKVAGLMDQRTPRRGRMTRPTPSGGEDA
jgi:hypothetical protein